FINLKYNSSKVSLNTQRLVGNIICQYLNFLSEKVKYNEQYNDLKFMGFKGLNIDYGLDFINSKKRLGLSKDYIDLIIYYLSDFYLYMNDSKITSLNLDTKLSEGSIKRSNIFGISGMRREEKSTAIKLKDFGENKYYLIPLFINISQNIAPEIALGICLQFFGGLRKGEVVNVTQNDITISNAGTMKVHIKDNSSILFSNKRDLKDESVKRANYLQENLREQEILNVPIVKQVFKTHMKYIKKYKKSRNGLLFFNKDGNAMSGQVYTNRFHKVKKHFLVELLNQERFDDYNLLSSTTWSTHIGRGIFTNLLIEMGLTEVQVAIVRGDRNTLSNRDYYDNTTSKRLINQYLPKIEEFLETK